MKKRVVIIGQGQIGKAVKYILRDVKRGLNIECWDIDEAACPNRKPLEKIIPRADILFLCIPSWSIRIASQDIRPFLPKGTITVSLSKGLDRASGTTVDRVLHENFPTHPTVLLSGPMLAEEIMEGCPAAAVAASRNRHARAVVTNLFNGTKLHVTPIADVKGTAICGILKNIFAMGLGMIEALKYGDNVRGLYMQMAIEEMMFIVKKLGGDQKTVYTQAGIGDLIATGFSKHSKNHEYGRILVKKGTAQFDSEGSVSIVAMSRLLKRSCKQLPLYCRIDEIVRKKKKPSSILNIF